MRPLDAPLVRPRRASTQTLAKLSTLLRHARDGCFAIALWDDPAARERVMTTLSNMLSPIATLKRTCSALDPYPIRYLSRLSEAQRTERAVIFFLGLEDALKALDYQRELLAQQPHGLVFWLTPEAAHQVARRAPHFWSQHSGIFDFATTTW
jgi:hypothetical protein